MSRGAKWNPDDMNDKQLAALEIATGKKKSKYNAEKTTVNGKKFDSKKEARIYSQLKAQPDVKFILRQVPFDLPGGYKHRVDFMIYRPDGSVEFYEAKGLDTPQGKMKRRQVEDLYGIKITVL